MLSTSVIPTTEFRLADSGLRFDQGQLRYAWFELVDGVGRRRSRAVALKELTYLPIETRDDPDLLGKQWAALRGLYNASVDFVYTSLGVFAPQHLGVLQFYGAAAEADSERAAAEEALRAMAAVEAILANYPLSRLASPDGYRVQLLVERMERLPRLLAVLGHPDPRQASRGLGRDGSLGEEDDDLASQQGEILLRGLARLQEDFVFLVTAAHIGRPALAQALVRMAQVAGQIASRQRGSLSAAFSMAIPLASALSSAHSGSQGRSDSLAQGESDSWSQGWSQGESQSWGHSVGQSQAHGTAHSESVATTDAVSHSQGHSQSVGSADSVGSAHTDSGGHTSSHSTGVAHSSGDSWSSSESSSTSQGATVSQGSSQGTAHSQTESWGQAHSDGVSQGESRGQATTWASSQGQSESVGLSHSQSAGGSASAGQSLSHSEGSGVSQSVEQGSNWSAGTNLGVSENLGASANAGANGSLGLPGVASLGGNVGGSVSAGLGTSQGVSQSQGGSESVGLSVSQNSTTSVGQNASLGSSWGESAGASVGHAVSSGQSVGGAASTGQSSAVSSSDSHSQGGAAGTTASQSQSSGVAQSSGTSHTSTRSQGGFSSTTNSESWGTADSVGWADSASQGHSDAQGQGWSESTAVSRATTRGSADSESWSQAVSEGWSEGRAVSRSQQTALAHGTNAVAGQAVAVGASRGFGAGLSAGLVPAVSIARSWQTEDDVAMRLTEVARGLESLLNQASMEGGFMTSALLFVGDGGERAAQALLPQAFHGPATPTPVLTVAGDADLRRQARAFRPSTLPEADPFGVGLLWSRWGTLLTPGMLAAYTAPNLFEEGTALTVQEKVPPLAFYPELAGDVVLGHLVSPETGDLTRVALRLSRERHFHTAFCGDTGYGKSVAAERLVYETALHWRLKSIVLDFGAGWRKLLNAPGLEGHVQIRQLSPGGVRPLRWNPLQIGRAILPEVQWRAFCDIFGSIAQLGQKRQIHELRDALRRVYLARGVLVDDPDCRQDREWGSVRTGEEGITGKPSGTPLADLSADARQALAVQRSRQVGLHGLYAEVERKLSGVPPRDSMLRGVLEGILFRLHPLVQGAAAAQYAAGAEAVDINEVVPGTWGVAVLEGGAFLDDFSKAFLLGWAAWHLYTDAVLRRMRRGEGQGEQIQIVFEEANKILAGLDQGGGGDESSGATSTAEQFAAMWRDSRKYGIWLHLITQSPSLIPPGILSSCNNLFVTQLKSPRDRDLAIAAIHRSEKGFVDEGWRRFLASLPVARSVVKLGYAFDRAELEPCYIQPLRLAVTEPSDAEIQERLG